MQKYLVILVIALSIPLLSSAQTVYKDYKDGRIYFQFTEEFYHKILNNLEDPDYLDTGFRSFPYKIRSINRPFDNSKNSRPLKRIVKLELADPTDIDHAIRFLDRMDIASYVEKSPLMEMSFTPNDPYYNNGKLWYLDKIQAPEAWNLSKGCRDVVVAVVDNAIQIEHPDLKDNIWSNPGEIPGNNLDDDGNGAVDDIRGWDVSDGDDYTSPPKLVPEWSHGTQTSGLVSATTNNGQGIAAIGYNLSIMPIKVESDASTTPTRAADAYEGLNVALNTPAVDIINMSWGFTVKTQTHELLIKEAANRGKILVAGAGNNGQKISFYPAMFPEVISVAGTDSLDKKSDFSNYNTWVDISAPASDIISSVLTVLDPPYYVSKGTSFATPMVAGTIGLMLTINPGLTRDQAMTCIQSSADPIDGLNPQYAGLLGAGRLNSFKAVQCAANLITGTNQHKTEFREVQIYPNPASGVFRINTGALGVVPLQVLLLDLRGRVIEQLFKGQAGQPGQVFYTGHLPPGIYVIQVTTPDQTIQEKLAIRH